MKQASTTEDWRIVRNALEDMRDTFEDLADKLEWQKAITDAFDIEDEDIQRMYFTLDKLANASDTIYNKLLNS